MSGNANLRAANKAKNDEFYTQLSDIEKELKHYKGHFRNKVVFCNCDDPEYSNFWEYFRLNFKHLGLRKLIATHYEPGRTSYKLELIEDRNHDGKINNLDIVKTPLMGDGDFRSEECVEILKEADIVVTNPPFSLFREYVAQLMQHDKKFLIIGNINAITYKEIFPLFKDNKIWMGATCFSGGAAYFWGSPDLYDPHKMSNPKHAYLKDGHFYWRVNGVRWFTNLDVEKRHEEIVLFKHYSPEHYPHYDNYNAINVDKVTDIPCDYYEQIGVPISFMDKYCPEQFEIIKFRKGDDDKDLCINGKCPYFRILIKRKSSNYEN